MVEIINYDDAVKTIRLAILKSQFDAAKAVNEKQLQLYYGIGKYISMNSGNVFLLIGFSHHRMILWEVKAIEVQEYMLK